jgi:hypothetical protein
MRRTSKTHRSPLPKRPDQGAQKQGDQVHVEAQKLWIAEQLCNGKPVYKLLPEIRQRFALSYERAKQRYNDVREDFVREDKEQIEKWKAEAQRRLFNGMNKAKEDLKDKPQALHATLLKYEDQLAKIQGTYAAVKIDIDVTVSASLVGVVANLSADQVSQYMESFRETTRQAAEYKRLTAHTVDQAAE